RREPGVVALLRRSRLERAHLLRRETLLVGLHEALEVAHLGDAGGKRADVGAADGTAAALRRDSAEDLAARRGVHRGPVLLPEPGDRGLVAGERQRRRPVDDAAR